METPPLLYAAELSCLLPVIVSIYRWKKLNIELKILALFFGYNLVHVVAEETLRQIKISNLFLGNIHQVIEIECFLFFYWKWSNHRVLKDSIQYIGIFYLVIWVFNQIYFNKPDKFDEVSALIANFFLIVVSVFALYELTDKATNPLSEYAIFWVAISIIIYCTGTIIIFSFSNIILEMGISYFTAFWSINWILSILSNVMFTRSNLCKTY